jgi:hypothetical protein
MRRPFSADTISARHHISLKDRRYAMHNPNRPIADSAQPAQSEMFAFCTTCNNISASERRACSLCGSTELELLTLRDISERLRDAILSRRNPMVADAMSETRFRLSF